MNIEKQCCTLQQAKRLKELGVMQDSFLCFAFPVINTHKSFDGEVAEYVEEYSDNAEITETWLAQFDGLPHFCAFTVAELGEMLPDGYDTMRVTEVNGLNWMGYDLDGSDFPEENGFATEAEARAAMLILLIENKLITPEEIHNRLKAGS